MATVLSRRSETQAKLLTAALWAAQVLLATVFLVAGMFKLSLPMDRLVEGMPWAAAVPAALVRLVGSVEVLGALALVLPTASRPLSRLAGAAAGGFVLMMMTGSVVHLMRGEIQMLPLNLMLGLLATFVTWARLREH